jgi:hypothetical protein
MRVRENQRRSRHRRKELVSELQQRISNYEQKEVQATILVQTAARKVDRQNAQLRKLLGIKGVSSEEIDEFLVQDSERQQSLPFSNSVARNKLQMGFSGRGHANQFCEDGSQTKHPVQIMTEISGRVERRDVKQDPVNSEVEDMNMDAAVTSPYSGIPRTPESLSTLPASNVQPRHTPIPVDDTKVCSELSPTSAGADCSCGDGDISTDFDNEQRVGSLPLVPDCFCPDVPTQLVPGSDKKGLEMSCEDAAGILTGMLGGDGAEHARSQLGCGENLQCNVQSIKVLQLMDIG